MTTPSPSVNFEPPIDHSDVWHGRVLAAGRDDDWWVGSYTVVRQVIGTRVTATLNTPTDVLALNVGADRIDAAPYRIEGGAVVPQPALFDKQTMDVFPEHTTARLAAWSHNGRVMALLGQQHPGRGKHRRRQPGGDIIRLWLMDGIERENRRQIWSGHDDKYTALHFGDDSLVLAGARLRVFGEGGSLDHESWPPADIADGCFADDGRRYVAALENGQIGVWDASSWALERQSGQHPIAWLSVAAHPRQPFVIVGAGDGVVAAFDVRTGAILQSTELPRPSAIHAVAIGADGDRVLLSTSGRMWTMRLQLTSAQGVVSQ